jgi:hypothetical protein
MDGDIQKVLELYYEGDLPLGQASK